MMVKRVFPLIFALALALTACGGQAGAQAPTPTPAATPAPTATAAPTPSPSPSPEPTPTPVPLIGSVLYEANGFRVTLADYEREDSPYPESASLSLEMCNDTDAEVTLRAVDGAVGGYMIPCIGNGVINIAGTFYFDDKRVEEPCLSVPAGETVTHTLNMHGNTPVSSVQFALEVTGAAGTDRSERINVPFGEVTIFNPDRSGEPFFENEFFTAACSTSTVVKGYTVTLSLSNLSEHTLCVTPNQMTANGMPVPPENLQYYAWRVVPGSKFLAEADIGQAEDYALSDYDAPIPYEVSLTVTDEMTGEVVAETGPVAFTAVLE